MKVLVLDIETSPATAYVWGLNKVYIDPRHVIEPTRVLCFAAKWLDKPKMYFGSDDINPHNHYDPGTMLHDLWILLDEADAVVHYNGTSFDVPHINRMFLLAGMPPPSPYAQIDLWRCVRSQFRFLSNKLDNVAGELGIGHKTSHEGMGLWTGCLAGDEGAWRRMKRYNIQDVRLTEQLYLELRPWIKGHPSHNLVDGNSHACPTCGSGNLIKRGLSRTKVGSFQRFQCGDCQSYSRSGKRVAGVDVRGL